MQQQILRFAQEDTVLSDQLFMSRSRSRFTLRAVLADRRYAARAMPRAAVGGGLINKAETLGGRYRGDEGLCEPI